MSVAHKPVLVTHGPTITWAEVPSIYKARFRKLWQVLRLSLLASVIALVAAVAMPWILGFAVVSGHVILLTAITVPLALLVLLISGRLYWTSFKLASTDLDTSRLTYLITERLSRLILVSLAVCSGIFPALFPDELKQHTPFFVIGAVTLATAAIIWQHHVDTREAALTKRLSHKLGLQEGRSATLKSIIKILTHPILLIERDQDWNPEQKREAVSKLNTAMTQILRALSKDVSVYVDEREDVSVNTNLMVAHRIENALPGVRRRLVDAANFLGFRRPLESYTHALELTLWGKEETEIPRLVLPVEDPKESAGKRRLLPGAPTAFALDQDQFVPDTHRIREYVESDLAGIGSELDRDVLEKLQDYFNAKQFRSFASLVLRDPATEKPIGVVNIQSDEPERFRRGNAEVETLIKSLEHYRYALQYVLNGQRKLLGIEL